MYNLSYIRSDGKSILLNSQNDIYVGKVQGASGHSVNLSTAQSFGQVGVTVQGLSIDGQLLNVSGYIPRNNMQKKRDLLSVFTPQSKGRLYWEDTYYIDVYVKESPSISQDKSSTFIMQLFAPYPYWRRVSQSVIKVGEVTPLYLLPISFSTPHQFGSVTPSSNFNLVNDGDVAVTFNLTVKASGGNVVNPTFTHQNGKVLSINGTIQNSHILTVSYSELGDIEVKYDGTDAYQMLDDLSTWFTIESGDNPISFTATSGSNFAEISVVYNQTYSGVLMSEF